MLMKSSRLEEYKNVEENIIKDVRSFEKYVYWKKLKKKGVKNLFRLKKKENKAIKYRILIGTSEIFLSMIRGQ